MQDGCLTSEALDAVLHAQAGAEPIQPLCFGTVHDVEDLPQHGAGQRAIGHLRHEEPDPQPASHRHRDQPTITGFCFNEGPSVDSTDKE